MEYNLSKENFITVSLLDGSNEMFSLRDILINAHRIRKIEYNHIVKIELFSFYRFLMQLITDIYRPGDEYDIQDILDNGKFDKDKIDTYFKKYQDRFDLFSKDKPFMQATIDKFDKPEAKSLDILSPILRQGLNDVFYNPIKYTSSEKEWDIAHIVYSLLFNSMCHVYTGEGYKAPIMGGSGNTPLFVLYEGENLFETLLFGMSIVKDTDIPYWRQNGYGEVYKEVNSNINYEFYPVMKFLLTEDGKIYSQSDNKHPIFDYSDGELKAIKTNLHIHHINTLTKKTNKGIEYILFSDTNEAIWLNVKVLGQNWAKNGLVKVSDAANYMEEENILPEKINVSFYGLFKGKGSPFRNIYESIDGFPVDILYNKEKQKEIDNFINYIEIAANKLAYIGKEYISTVFDTSSPNVGIIEEYKSSKERFYKAIRYLVTDKYIKDPRPDMDEYLKNVDKTIYDTFKKLTVLKNDILRKKECEKKLSSMLFKERKKIYGTEDK